MEWNYGFGRQLGQCRWCDVQATGRRLRNDYLISFRGKDFSLQVIHTGCAPIGLLLDWNQYSLPGFIANKITKLRKTYAGFKPKNLLIVPSPRYLHFMGRCLTFTAIPNHGFFQFQGNYLIKFLTCCVPGDAQPNMLFWYICILNHT
jgi:hypothetical protein